MFFKMPVISGKSSPDSSFEKGKKGYARDHFEKHGPYAKSFAKEAHESPKGKTSVDTMTRYETASKVSKSEGSELRLSNTVEKNDTSPQNNQFSSERTRNVSSDLLYENKLNNSKSLNVNYSQNSSQQISSKAVSQTINTTLSKPLLHTYQSDVPVDNSKTIENDDKTSNIETNLLVSEIDLDISDVKKINKDAFEIVTSQPVQSENDERNQELNLSNSDITDMENTDLNSKKNGKRKRLNMESENNPDDLTDTGRGRRRSSRIKSLEDKRKESPKTSTEQSKSINNSANSSKEHSPVHESTESTHTVESDNKTKVIYTQAYLQQLKTTPQVTDIPVLDSQAALIKTKPCQSSNSDTHCKTEPRFEEADKSHSIEDVEKVLTFKELDSSVTQFEENNESLSVKHSLEIKTKTTDISSDLFEDESGEEHHHKLDPCLPTVEVKEESTCTQSSDDKNLSKGESEKSEIPDYKAMGILKESEIPVFESVLENMYLTERKRSKASKEARRMLCDCTTSSEDRRRGLRACDENCLNRLLMIECSSRCPCGDYCTNKRFQRREYAPVGVFYSKDKGHGLKALRNIGEGTFIMEYCGEVLNFHEFQQRVKQYNKAKQHHFYFMALKTDEIIDATKRGNTSRFINHSCNPNCETQKWTVNGSLRVGFFTRRVLAVGEELTFDYQFEVYGEEAQKCCCGAENCRGYIGKRKSQPKGRDVTPRRRSTQDRRKRESFEDISLDEEIDAMCSDLQNEGLQKADHALRLSRFMVRAETSSQRLKLLKVLQDTKKQDCLKYFLTHHGLALIWSWMVDLGDNREELQIQILATLDILPIPHKNMLEDSKVKSVVSKWAQEAIAMSKSVETEVEYSSASDTPSRAETPSITSNQNTPVPAKEEDTASITSIVKEDNVTISTPTKEKSYREDAATPKSIKDSSEAPKKKLLRQLQSEGVLANSPSNEDSESKGNKEISGNIEGVPSGSVQVKLDFDTDIVITEENEDNAKIDEDSKDSSALIAEAEPKSWIAKAAASLLEAWSSLKEIYIIPKLDKDKDRERDKDKDKKDRERYREKEKSDRDRDRNRDYDRYRERSRERERNRYDRDGDRYRDRDRRDRRRDYKKRSRSRSKERDEKRESESKTLPKLRKPWKDQLTSEPNRKRTKELSKQERRQAFEREMEEQMQKKEEEKKYKEEMMQQHMMDGYYDNEMQFTLFDNNGFPIPPHYSIDPNAPDMPPFPIQFPDHLEPGMMPPPGMGVPPDGMMPVDGNDQMIFHHVDENGMPIPYVEPAIHHGAGMMHPEQLPHGWEANHGAPIFPHQSSAIQEHMLPPGMQEHMGPQGMSDHMGPQGMSDHMGPQGMSDHMGPQGMSDHMGPGAMSEHMAPAAMSDHMAPAAMSDHMSSARLSEHMVADHIQPTTQGPAPAQTTTFITADGMLITQTITPLADPNVHQLQNQLINQNLTSVNTQAASSTSMRPTIISEDIPSPPKPPASKLPPNWKTATDSEGKIYYYHSITRQTQWDPPSWDGNDAVPGDDEAEMDLGTPTYDERKHKKTTTAAADTSSETAKRCKDHFRSKMSGYVVTVLNTYRKPDCKIGRITNTEDFKHLARKLTHGIMAKELKHCKNMEDLEVNSNVKHKAKEYIRKYMGRYGSLYRKEPD